MPRGKQAGTSEANIQRDVMMALSEAGCLVFRNQTGVLPNAKGIPVRFGLCVGSSDLIGICPDGRFLAVEVKTATGRVRPEQERFIAAVIAKGGRSGVARSVDDVAVILAQAVK